MMKNKISILPNKPGCYLYLNKNNEIIYIGKAKNIKKRVSSYFTKSHNLKTTRLVSEIRDINYYVVENEKESLILESDLIKKYRPKYNVILNDDKAYPYIIITNEKDPMYKFQRKYNKKALKNYGPLPIGSKANMYLNLFQTIFPLRRCKGNLNKPCFYYQIGMCSGACFKDVDFKYYKKQIKNIELFFKGKVDYIKNFLLKEREIASNNLLFERAGFIQKQIETIDFFISKQTIQFNSNKNIDAINFYIDEDSFDKISISISFYRNGSLSYNTNLIAEYGGQNITELISTFISNIYKKNILPDNIIIPRELDIFEINNDLLNIISYPIKDEHFNILNFTLNNAKESLRIHKLNNESYKYNDTEILNTLYNIANLRKTPNYISVFDISNILNENIIGAVIVYKNAKQSYNDFRKYNIPSDITSDFKRIGYTVEKYLNNLLKDNKQLPDLLIIDGHKNQLVEVKKVLNKLNLIEYIDVIALTKDNKHKTEYILDFFEQKIFLDNIDKKVSNWLFQAQYSVDQYAKKWFRKSHSISLLENQLKKIKGISEKKSFYLYKEFKTIDNIKKQNFDSLNKIIKNKTTTNRLIEYFKIML